MTKVIAGIALLFLVGGTGSSADAATPSWCVFYDGSTYNCSFYSHEQCYETARGAGGWCRPNFFQGYTGGQPSAPRDRKPRTTLWPSLTTNLTSQMDEHLAHSARVTLS